MRSFERSLEAFFCLLMDRDGLSYKPGARAWKRDVTLAMPMLKPLRFA